MPVRSRSYPSRYRSPYSVYRPGFIPPPRPQFLPSVAVAATTVSVSSVTATCSLGTIAAINMTATPAAVTAAGSLGVITGIATATVSSVTAVGSVGAVSARTSIDDLVFSSNRTGNYEIYKLVDGVVTQLTNNSLFDSYWPRVSPNGQTILFSRAPAGVHDTDSTQNSTWTMKRDGSSVTQILAVGVDSWVVQGHPNWSPDGTKIVLFAGFFDIYTCNPDGSGRAQVTTTGHVNGETDPAYTPDGTKILYCFTSGGFANVFYVPSAGGTPTALTTGSNNYYDPVADPTSSTVAYLAHTSSNSATDWNIRKVSITGTGDVAVIADGNINSRPEWSADGNWLYFHRNPPGPNESGTFSLYKIKPDGSGLTPIPSVAGSSTSEYPGLLPVFTLSVTSVTATASLGSLTVQTTPAPLAVTAVVTVSAPIVNGTALVSAATAVVTVPAIGSINTTVPITSVTAVGSLGAVGISEIAVVSAVTIIGTVPSPTIDTGAGNTTVVVGAVTAVGSLGSVIAQATVLLSAVTAVGSVGTVTILENVLVAAVNAIGSLGIVGISTSTAVGSVTALVTLPQPSIDTGSPPPPSILFFAKWGFIGWHVTDGIKWAHTQKG